MRMCTYTVILLLGISFSGQAQDYFIKRYTTEEGLSYNHIRDIKQDHFGFLWVATWDGLSRFDGYEFKTFQHMTNDSTSLPEFEIQSIEIDRYNLLWIKTKNKLSLFNRENEHFKTFTPGNSDSFPHQNVYSMALDTAGNLWVQGDSGISQWNNQKKRFKNYKLNPSTQMYQIYFDNLNRLWDGLYDIYNFTPDEYNKPGNFTHIGKFRISNEPMKIRRVPSLNYHFKYVSFTSPSEKVWGFSNFGIYLLETITATFHPYGKIPSLPEICSANKIWWATPDSGIFYLNKESEEIKKIVVPNCQWVTSFLQTGEKEFWFSGMDISANSSGLIHYVEPDKNFNHYLTEGDDKGQPFMISSLIRDNERNLYVGSRNYNHLICIRPNGHTDYLVEQSPSDWQNEKHPRSMIIDREGNLWIGYLYSLLIKLNLNSRNVTSYFPASDHPFNKPPEFMIRGLKMLKNGELLIVSNGAFVLFSPSKQKILKKINVPLNQPFCLYESQDGNFWSGGSFGKIFRINPEFDGYQEFSLAGGEDINMEDICETDSVYLWIATMGNGICRFNRKDGTSRFFTTADGLSDNVTYSILSDSHKRLWVSTNRGISRYDPSIGSFRIFGKSDGLLIEEFNSDAAYFDKDGTMFFGGVGGIVSFHPDSIKESVSGEKISPLLLTELTVSGHILPGLQDCYAWSKISLPKGTTNFQTKIVCLDFKNSGKIRYRHWLAGIDKEWIETDSKNRVINYAGLKPGKYLLSTEATNLDGEWVSKKQLEIRILPFFYQTNLFRFLIGLLIAGLIAVIILLRIRQIKSKEEKALELMKQQEKELVYQNERLRLDSLQGQLNPHFIFNSLNSINYFISVQDKLSANRYLTKFAELMRAFLKNSINDFVPFNEEIKVLNDYLHLESLRFGDQFSWSVVIDEALETLKINIVPSMIQPFLENAIWHGFHQLKERKGILTVRFNPDGENLIYCEIDDDGIGRKESENRKSEGQKNRQSRAIGIIRQRIHLYESLLNIKGSIEITDLYPDREETGTRVILLLPVKYENLNPT